MGPATDVVRLLSQVPGDKRVWKQLSVRHWVQSVRGVATLGACVFAALPTRVQAAPRADFRYLRDEGSLSCPNEATLRAAVAARLGYDPFEKGAPRVVRATIETDAKGGYSARVELQGGGEGQMLREYSTQGSCNDLVSAIALSISLAIDAERSAAEPPLRAVDPAAPETPAPPPEQSGSAGAAPKPPAGTATAPQPLPQAALRCPICEAPAVEAKTETQRFRLGFQFAAGAHAELALGSAPGTAVGSSLFIQGRRNAFSIGLELRVDAPAGKDLPSGAHIQSGLVGFALVPCLHFQWFRGCAILFGGEIWGRSQNIDVPRTAIAFHGAAGLRAGFEWPRNAAWALSAHADALALLSPVDITINGSTVVWSAPGVFATVGAGALLRF